MLWSGSGRETPGVMGSGRAAPSQQDSCPGSLRGARGTQEVLCTLSAADPQKTNLPLIFLACTYIVQCVIPFVRPSRGLPPPTDQTLGVMLLHTLQQLPLVLRVL